MANDLHQIQIQVLRKLLFNPQLRYTDLRPAQDIENNKLNFHLNTLKKLGLIIKKEEFYSLTNKGKELAGRLDTDDLKVKKQAKISAWVCPIRNKGKETEYLIYTRLKSPFYGCQGFMSGKVDYGERVIEAAKRELKEECNLEGESKIIALKHYRVFDANNRELVEDKFMFLITVNDPSGDLKQSEEGQYEWVKESELKKFITNPFESWEAFETLLTLLKNPAKDIHFIEDDHYSIKF